MSIDDLDKLEQKQMMKERPLTKNTWYNWLINHISESIKKQWMMLKTKS